jgi:hypothetical protein
VVSKNLILGWLYDRSFDEIKAFLVAFLKAKIDAKLVILGGYTDGGGYTWQTIKDLGIEFVSVPHGPEKDDLTHYISRRYCWYDWYLSQHPEYERVMITGIRDVIIQSDPFAYDSGGDLCCFLESRIIKECSWNRMWLQEGFCREVLESIWENPISCAEIVLGNYARMTTYIKLMLPHICGPNLKIRIIDQAVHNYLLWNKQLEPVRLFKPGEGPVCTMGYVMTDGNGKEMFKLNDRHQVLNDDGSVVQVIHQYDRDADLNVLFRSIYA